MSTSRKHPTQPEGPAPEFTTREDVEAMIDRLDKKWCEIKKLLQTEEDLLVESDANNLAREAEEEPGEDWLRSLPFQQANFGMSPGETDALLDGAKALDPEHEIRERLVKVQWQTVASSFTRSSAPSRSCTCCSRFSFPMTAMP